MTDKKPVPPSLAQFALEQLAEAGEQAAIDLTVQNVEILRAEIVKRDARIAELEAERNRLLNNPKDVFKKMCDMALKQRDEFAADLAALKAQQPSGVVLPDTKHLRSAIDGLPDSYSKDDVIYGWQEALELVASLNPCRAQSVPDTERLAFLLEKYRKVIVERIPTRGGERHEIYVEEGFMSDTQYPPVKVSGDWSADPAAQIEAKRKAIDLAIAAAPSAQQKESE